MRETTTEPAITEHDEPPAADVAVVDQGLDAHNEAAAPLRDVRPLARKTLSRSSPCPPS